MPRLQTRTFLLAAILIAGWLFAPTSAHAECGDYIVYTDGSHSSMPAHDGPAKCSGPNCSQAPPPAPLPQAPAKLRILVDEAVALAGSPDPCALDRSLRPFDALRESPIHRPSDVYHPPR